MKIKYCGPQSECPFCHKQEGTRMVPYVGSYRDPEMGNGEEVAAAVCRFCGRVLAEVIENG